MTTYLLMDWMISGSNTKSIREVNQLVKQVITSKDFDVDYLAVFNTQHKLDHLDSSEIIGDTKPFSGCNSLTCYSSYEIKMLGEL